MKKTTRKQLIKKAVKKTKQQTKKLPKRGNRTKTNKIKRHGKS